MTEITMNSIVADRRGFQTWKRQGKEQNYDGEFFRHCLHGEGTYKWKKEKGWETCEGYFYANVKEGYGVVSLSNGSCFEGLFYKNRPFGPGILTYPNGRQDAGFWLGSKMIRLSRVVDYIIPRLASSSAGKMKLFPYRKIITVNSESNVVTGAFKLYESKTALYSNFINDPRSLFFNKRKFNESYFKRLNYEYSFKSYSSSNKIETEDVKSVTVDDELSYYSSYELNLEKSKAADTSESVIHQTDEHLETELVCWNRNKICEEIVEQIFNFRSLEDKLNFNISSLITGDRLQFHKTGYKEKECIHFLKMCSIGPSSIIKESLCSCNISEELTDTRGNNSLMFAACADQHDVIEILVEHGVDINSFNDEHLTPLNLCLLRRIARENKIGNWESAFLPPTPESDLYQKIEDWEGTKSFESLDRLFGDGMSIDENPTAVIPPSIQESLTNFQSRHNTTMSTITVLKFSQEKKPIKTESIYHDENEKIISKTIRREEYLNSVAEPTGNDKYFFDLYPEPKPVVEAKKPLKGKGVKEVIIKVVEENPKNEEIIKKCEIINKTIEILLKKGADPNISEMPKSSIHLGVFTKDPRIVKILLKFKAFVDTRSSFQEGFLTPLHVMVLMKPAEELLRICHILFEYNADPEAETSPHFNPNGEREIFLDEERGRTPLQLLCMRPDLEYVKHNKYLIEIGLILAKNSDRKNVFKGYNFLTLAMLRNNIKLVEAFLINQLVDPNEACKHGPPLHVLVSTFLQIRIPYDESIQMCDLLLNNGADPLKKSEKGNCVEYGYKEIDEEKEKRKLEKGKDKSKGRDHLKDHVKVVEYLDKKVKESEEKIKKELEQKTRKKSEEKGEFAEDTKSILGNVNRRHMPGKMKIEDTGDKEKKEQGKTEEGKREKNVKSEGSDGKEKNESNDEHKGKKGKANGEDGKEKKGKSEKDEQKGNKEKVGDGGGKEKEEKEILDARVKKQEKDAKKQAGLGKSDTDNQTGKKAKESIQNEKHLKELNKTGTVKADKNSFQKLSKKKTDESDINEQGKNIIDKKGKKIPDEIQAKGRLNRKTESNFKALKEKEKFEKLKREIFMKGETIKDKPCNFSEKLQRLLYKILGDCQDSINVNDFLLPYVVLRDGDLYYHFKEQKPKNMEAYSLI